MKINKVITVTLDSEDVEKAIKDYIVKSDDSLKNINVSATEIDGTFKIAITQDAVDVPAVKVEEPETTVSDDDSVEKDLGSTEEETDTTTDYNPFGL
jgi:hypothetical protein